LLSPKCSKTHLRASLIPKIFPGVIPPDPRSKGREWEGRKTGRESGKGRKGRGIEQREWKGRGGRKRGGEGMDAPGAGPPKIFGVEPPLIPQFTEKAS
jgi:hypothetical protein